MFEKIAKYIGENLQLLVGRPDGTYCFRLHNDRVYYVSEMILKLAANISGDKLVSLGTCFRKFTKTHKFRLHVTHLEYLAPYAKYKVYIPLGFGVAAKSTQDCRKVDPMAIVVFH
ncbi:60S ribosome subunit biogenesis protein NIP7 homolog [Cricetulus griseus]|uniref:60S ribosome subunit biogenesis protein NIP7 homolog n=1 Tax=Cricetulus griseus TaxID=10029 RepID=A0A9J7F099_CRIGR|nr:60S ribosome subunit biogenesis protein NIP7 homolog [Cricetulus griseus]XP_027243535.1 60S ribosome subunit biogenesis protein NIP7 homolog [Cricetulus griseus]